MRPFLRSLAFGLLATAWLSHPATAQVISAPAAGATLPAGDDFATATWGDPWDMRNVEDVAQFPPGLQGWSWSPGQAPTFSGETWTGTTATGDAFVTLLWQGLPPGQVLHVGRYGVNTPIPAGSYRKMSLRFRLGAAQTIGFHWFKDRNQPPTQAGGKFYFGGRAGWNVVQSDLATSATGGSDLFGSPWSGSVLGLRIDPNDNPGTLGLAFELDWVRLTRADSDPQAVRTPITWSGAGASSVVEVLDAAAEVVQQVGSGASGSVTWFYGYLPPGTYTIRVRTGSSTLVSRTIAINDPPVVQVLDPDEAGGPDWAVDVKGNAWDMNDAGDVTATRNVTGASYGLDGGRTVFSATSLAAPGSLTGDPYLFLAGGAPNPSMVIDAARYHRFSFRMKVDYASPADWVTTRVLWGKDPGDLSKMTMTQDIMVWNNEYRTYTVDLATLGADGVEPGGLAGLWNGTIQHLRFDPLEYPEATHFAIDETRLCADDETTGAGRFAIRWAVTDGDAGDAPMVSLYYDTDRDPTSGLVAIVNGLPASQGVYAWNASRVPAGSYYVYAVVTDGRNSQGRYSSGPVRVWHASGVAPMPAVSADFTGDGRADLAVFRASAGRFYVQGLADQVIGTPGEIPVPGDYDGDLRVDAATWSPSTGRWTIAGQTPVTWGMAGDVPVPGDYNGDGRTDPAVFRPSTGQWIVSGLSTIVFGAAGDVPVPADYDGDGVTDVAVFRRATGSWMVRGLATVAWGTASDIPVPADVNGDGIADFVVYRPASATFYVYGGGAYQVGQVGDLPLALDLDGDGRTELIAFRQATGTWTIWSPATGATNAQRYGTAGDLPAGRRPEVPRDHAADFDGDRRTDLSVFRPSSGAWLSLLSAAAWRASSSVLWGTNGDVPLAGDYVGRGTDQPVVFRSGFWYVQGGPTVSFGLATDIPVPRDYDGDGRVDIAVFRDGTWYVLRSSSGFSAGSAIAFGTAGDLPVPADYDGDGKADPAVFRAGTWFVRYSGGAAPLALAWGAPSDVPVPADYDGDGRADLALFRPSTGTWYIRLSTGTATSIVWGLATDIVAPGDYDGDGVADLAVYRPSTGTWYVRRVVTAAWGLSTDLVATDR